MPPVLNKSLKTVCVDTVLFFATFALVGHLSINFWEKYTIQNELITMKHSLHSLKDTITNIGKAYDSLYTELRELFMVVDQNHQYLEKKQEPRCKSAYNFSHKGLHTLQVETLLSQANQTKNTVGVITESNKHIEPYGYEHKATGPLGENATTNTKNPPAETGTATDDQTSMDRITHIAIPNECYKDLEHCRHVCRQTRLGIFNKSEPIYYPLS